MLNAAERSHRARIAAYTMHARHDPKETTRAATEAVFAKYAALVDPDGRLDPDERRRRVKAAMRADLARLSFQAVKARREQQDAEEAAQLIEAGAVAL